jgi:hypothetical protein
VCGDHAPVGRKCCRKIAGLDHADLYAVAAHLHAQRLAIAFNCKFARAVEPLERNGDLTGERTHIDDMATALPSHQGQHGPAHAVQTEQIRVELRPRFLDGRVLDGPRNTEPRIVDQDIHASADAHHFLNAIGDGSLIGHIETKMGCPRDRRGISRARGGKDTMAIERQGRRGGAAKARARAGQQNHPRDPLHLLSLPGMPCPDQITVRGALATRLGFVDLYFGSGSCDHRFLTGNDMNKVFEKIKEELLAMLPPTIFFFLTLSLVALLRMLMTKGTGLPLSTPIQVAVGALILGKAVLIADMLPVINRYPDKPLAYNVAWKTAIYILAAAVIHYLERLVDFWREAGGFIAGNEKLLAEIVWPHFWAVHLLLSVLIFQYCVMHELVRVMGATKIRAMFFGEPA